MAAAKKMQTVRKTVERHFSELALISMSTPQDDPTAINSKCRWGMPVVFWGGSGIGKSDQVKQAATKAGLPVEVLMPGQQQPENFSGVLVPNAKSPEGVSIECLLPAVRRLNRIGKGVLFVDEAANAPPAVQGAMLGMLLDRIVGDTEMSPHIRILLASNPPEIAAGGYGFEPPTANRMAHFFLGPPSWEAWNRWFMSKSHPIQSTGKALEPDIITAWPNVYPVVQGMISGFLNKHVARMYCQPAAGDPNGGFAWESPRSWDNVSKMMATRMALRLPQELDDIIVAGLVGEGSMEEFATWRLEADLPSPDDVLTGKWKHNKNRIDKTHAVLSTLIPYVGMKPEGQQRFETAVKVWDILDQLCDAGVSDLVVDPMTVMINQYQLGMSNKTPQDLKAAAQKVIKRFAKSPIAGLIGATP